MYLIFYSFIKNNELVNRISVVKPGQDLKEEFSFILFNDYSIDNIYYIDIRNVKSLSVNDLLNIVYKGD